MISPFTIRSAFSFLIIIYLFGCPYFILQNHTLAQTFVTDTITISFASFAKIKPVAIIDTVIDHRMEDPQIIGEYEKSKFLFVPVDLYIYTKHLLCNEISKTIQNPQIQDNSLRFGLIIDEFRLTKKSNSLFYPRYLLFSSIQIQQRNSTGEPRLLGILLYESTSRKAFWGDKLRKGFQSVTSKWHQEFSGDINQVLNDFMVNQPPALENFRSGNCFVRPVNMITGVDIFGGTKGWMTDWEIYFSHREAKKHFFRSGYNIRFRQTKTFESIEFGRSNDYWFFRWHPNILLRFKSQLMFGFNRWKNINIINHKIWDAVIIDYSLSQSFLYNPLDKRSILFGFGFMENIYYVYSKRIQFQLGLLINVGLKL